MTAAKTEVPRMEIEELLALPVSFPFIVAARAHGLRRSQAYELVRRGEFPCPVNKLGRNLKVTRADLFKSLGFPADMISKSQLKSLKQPAA
jgi:hypothetical protein